MNIEALDDSRSQLAEGPVWDEAEQSLYWTDALAPAILRHDWATRTTTRWDLKAESVGSLAVRTGGGLILAMDEGFYTFDPATGDTSPVFEPFAGQPANRFNDGKTDRQGRFVSGGVNGVGGSDQPPQPVCSMFTVGADLGVTPGIGGFACFNGPCFSPDGRTFYVNGRGDMRHIEAFDYDPDTGEIGEGRVLIGGLDPDGTTVDTDGFLWCAQWESACVLRISPDGEIDRRIDLPGHVVSSVMIGGLDLDILFVTTLGRPYWGSTPTADDAGAVLVIRDLGLKGIAESRFAG